MADPLRVLPLPQGFEIRRLATTEEYREAEELQAAVWRMMDRAEITPLHVLITAQKNGGLVLGAFTPAAELAGFLFGFLGTTPDGKLKHVSHQMGVLPEYRGMGLGYLLKRAQRGEVRRQGLDLVTWTFDPLETVNASLNLTRLGAVCSTYLRNVYGEMRDTLNQRLPSDRFQVDWWIRSRWVHEVLSLAVMADLTEAVRRLPLVNPAGQTQSGLLEPGLLRTSEPAFDVLLQVPYDFQTIKARDMGLAEAWRMHTRHAFEHFFGAGYTAVQMLRGTVEHAPAAYYRLVQPVEGPEWQVAEHAAVEAGRAMPDALTEFAVLYNDGRYWKAHEILEPVWAVAVGADRLFLQGLIRSAAAFHKLIVQANPRGAARHLHWVIETLEPLGPVYAGVNLAAFVPALRRVYAALDKAEGAAFDRAAVPVLEFE